MPSDIKHEPEPSSMVAVYLVTFRRHALLRRSMASVLAQTYTQFRLYVVNDDPLDNEVTRIVASFNDPRAEIFAPSVKRGATGSFALVFAESSADFTALLEDDNWWEPTFLESQLGALRARTDMDVVVGNERIWREQADGTWLDTGQTIWPAFGIREHTYTFDSLCGSAKYCNSSALIRVARNHPFTVPTGIPVDVTEHFRERTFGPIILLNGAPLTNYAETLATARETRGYRWGHYQQLLIGSCFTALATNQGRRVLAQKLWHEVENATSPRAVTLVFTGLSIGAARILLWTAPIPSIGRALLTIMRRPGVLVRLEQTASLRDSHTFLSGAPLTQLLSRAFDRWTQ